MRRINSIDDLMATWRKSKALVIGFKVGYGGKWDELVSLIGMLETEFPQIEFVKVDVSKMKIIGEMLDLSKAPTLYFIKRGKVTYRMVGFNKYETLRKYAQDLI